VARIRTLKPEHGQHRKIGPLSDRAFRVWVSGLVTQADDEGRLVVDPEEIRVKVFGYHPAVTTDDVVEAIGEVIQRRLLHVYEDEGQIIGQLHDWPDHQAVRKSSHFKDSSLPCLSPSATIPPVFRQYSATVPQVFRPPRKGTEGKGTGTEGKGKEGSLRGTTSGITPQPPQGGALNGFQEFWARYPRKEGIGKAEEAWMRHVKTTPLLDILEGIGRWEHSEKWREGFIPMPATWLNQKRWRDTPLVKSKQSAAQQLWDQAQREKETSE